MYQLKSLLTACFILLVVQQDILGQQKKKAEPTKPVKNTKSETPNNVSVKQSAGPQSNLQGFKANKMSTRDGRFGVPEEIAPDRFGLRGGIGQVIIFEGEQSDLIPTFEIGAFANIGFTPRSRFQPEIYYQSKATQKNDITLHINMLNVPLLYQYRFGYDAKSFFIEVGPYASYLTSMNYFSYSVNNTIDLSGLSFGDRVEMGVVAGAGYRFDKRWFVDLRANYGLKKIKDFNNFTTVSLGVGYGF
ncbi:porin family protein [Cellulophaga sp. BC115SP]|uniref:porin family protein n=1 Tax=Cellulophaga sp. BC115SP TaxID=2683263 RepID=UPI001411CB77|nr:porin family protein [Cellulophaga sp. BC115SP]NBB29128.1 outer membrane beta-barrel protein [Cellulophaga sp. BC115SP]